MKNMPNLAVSLSRPSDQIINIGVRAAVGVSSGVRTFTDAIVTYVVDCTISLEEMIMAGGYDSVDSRIVAERFPIIGRDVGEWEFKQFDFNRSISPEAVIAGIVAEDSTNPWQPARTEHMLTYGAQNPGAQLRFPIVGLGSASEFEEVRGVICLQALNPKRFLSLRWWTRDGTWGKGFRFLGVRKKLVQVPAA